jgi:hypothetical protein
LESFDTAEALYKTSKAAAPAKPAPSKSAPSPKSAPVKKLKTFQEFIRKP